MKGFIILALVFGFSFAEGRGRGASWPNDPKMEETMNKLLKEKRAAEDTLVVVETRIVATIIAKDLSEDQKNQQLLKLKSEHRVAAQNLQSRQTVYQKQQKRFENIRKRNIRKHLSDRKYLSNISSPEGLNRRKKLTEDLNNIWTIRAEADRRLDELHERQARVGSGLSMLPTKDLEKRIQELTDIAKSTRKEEDIIAKTEKDELKIMDQIVNLGLGRTTETPTPDSSQNHRTIGTTDTGPVSTRRAVLTYFHFGSGKKSGKWCPVGITTWFVDDWSACVRSEECASEKVEWLERNAKEGYECSIEVRIPSWNGMNCPPVKFEKHTCIKK